MKYPQLSAVVPQGEHFDDSVVNEGVWLTAAHLNNIEAALSTNAELDTTMNSAIATMTGQIDGLVDTAVKDAATIRTQSARIVELEATVEKLEAKPSGNGSVLIAGAKDDSAEGNVGNEGRLPRFDDPAHPGNQSAKMFERTKK